MVDQTEIYTIHEMKSNIHLRLQQFFPLFPLMSRFVNLYALIFSVNNVL